MTCLTGLFLRPFPCSGSLIITVRWFSSTMTAQHPPTEPGAAAEPLQMFAAEQEPQPSPAQALLPPCCRDSNICNRTTGKVTSQNKPQPGSSGEIWAQIFPLLLTVVGVEGRALCPTDHQIFCCVTCSCSAQAQIMWIRDPSTREFLHQAAHPALVPVAALQQQKVLCCWQFPLGQTAPLPDGHQTPEFQPWKDALVHLVAASAA